MSGLAGEIMMFKRMNQKWVLTGLILAAAPALALAKRPVAGGTPDLSPASIELKVKCKETSCTVKNFRLYVDNIGDGDAKNSRIHYFLSDDTSLSTETDVLIHQHSLGAIKAGKTKKKTVGGGVLKNAGAVPGQYVIALVDADEQTTETDENNNVAVSPPLPE